jgi:hypothetical protein
MTRRSIAMLAMLTLAAPVTMALQQQEAMPRPEPAQQRQEGGQEQAPPEGTATGTVLRVSDDTIVVRTEDGSERRFARDWATRTYFGIAEGDRVAVSFRDSALHDERFATTVELRERARESGAFAPAEARRERGDARTVLPDTADGRNGLAVAALALIGAAAVLRLWRG